MNNPQSFSLAALTVRLKAEWKLKFVLLVALNLWVYAPYYFLQRHHLFQPIVMPLSRWDRLTPFYEQAVWIYLSLDLLMPIGPFLMNQRRQIFQYAFGIALIGVLADLVFIFWPTSCPRPEPGGTSPLYRLVIQMDYPFHAFPSLHAAFAVYSVLCAAPILREIGIGAPGQVVMWFWALLILAATLLTKQHVIVDLLGGAFLGLGVHFFVFICQCSPSKALSRSVANHQRSSPTVQL
jgi:membrane-associated phospholipid phosphatase